jgi:hypothetical protein
MPGVNPTRGDLSVGFHEPFTRIPKLHPDDNVPCLPYGPFQEGFQEEQVLHMQ